MVNKKTSNTKGKTVPKFKNEVYPMAPGNPYANASKKSTAKKTGKKK